MKNRLISMVLATGLLVSLSAFAGDSELDGKAKKGPELVIKHLDEKSKQLVTYEIATVPADMKEEALDKLSKEDKHTKIEAFLKANAVKANQVSEEKAEVVKGVSELDKDKSTAAHGYRYRGYYGGYYGSGFYGQRYGGYRNYYRPYYGYSYNSGYYNSSYYGNGGYYGYANNGYYGGYYDNCPQYTFYYCN